MTEEEWLLLLLALVAWRKQAEAAAVKKKMPDLFGLNDE